MDAPNNNSPGTGHTKANIKASCLPATQAWGCAQRLRVQYAERTAYIAVLATRAGKGSGIIAFGAVLVQNSEIPQALCA